jgi:hypothetical protein
MDHFLVSHARLKWYETAVKLPWAFISNPLHILQCYGAAYILDHTKTKLYASLVKIIQTFPSATKPQISQQKKNSKTTEG